MTATRSAIGSDHFDSGRLCLCSILRFARQSPELKNSRSLSLFFHCWLKPPRRRVMLVGMK